MKKGLPKERFRLLDLGSAITWGLAWVVLASTLATPAASWASLLTGFLGFFIGRKLVGSSLRTPTVALGVLLALPLSYFLLSWPTRSPFLASLFPSPTSLVLVTDFLTWGAAAFLVVGSFQLVSGRYPIFISLEVLIVALCLATPFAAHRDGFINRPYFLIDPLWSRGYDPVPILQGLGILVAVALVLLTIGRATKRSSLLDLILLSLMALTLYLYIPQEALRDLVADPPGSSGLTGEPREAQDDEDGVPPPQGSGAEPMSGSTGGDGDSSDNPFPFETSQKQEPKPVAVVIFRDDYDPPDGYYYFRQTAFSQFNGFRLVKDTTDKADRDLFKRFATQTERVPPPAARFNVRTRKLETRIALISSHKEPFGLVNPVQMTSAPNPKPDQFERAYDVESQVYIGDYSDVLASRLQSSAWSEELKQHYLGYPENDPRYLELAQEIVEIVPEQYRDYPLAMALAITLHLGENGIYTLKPRPVGESEDPTADFLFGDMTGYCVHFSHASVYLMRSLGIPARVAAGYAVEARNRRGSALLIRSSEAHAWPEIWLEGLGWHPLDVSPQTNLDTSDPPPDFDLQAMLAEMAREEKELFDQPPRFDLRQWLRNLFEKVARMLPWLLGALIFLGYGFKVERRFAYRFEKGEKRLHCLYRAALDKLGEVGVHREYGQDRLTFAKQNKEKYPNLLPLTEAHLKMVFGDPELRNQTMDEVEILKRYRSFEQDLNCNHPWWRRALGLANPISWLWTK